MRAAQSAASDEHRRANAKAIVNGEAVQVEDCAVGFHCIPNAQTARSDFGLRSGSLCGLRGDFFGSVPLVIWL
jgi:hypothetical protein